MKTVLALSLCILLYSCTNKIDSSVSIIEKINGTNYKLKEMQGDVLIIRYAGTRELYLNIEKTKNALDKNLGIVATDQGASRYKWETPEYSILFSSRFLADSLRLYFDLQKK